MGPQDTRNGSTINGFWKKVKEGNPGKSLNATSRTFDLPQPENWPTTQLPIATTQLQPKCNIKCWLEEIEPKAQLRFQPRLQLMSQARCQASTLVEVQAPVKTSALFPSQASSQAPGQGLILQSSSLTKPNWKSEIKESWSLTQEGVEVAGPPGHPTIPRLCLSLGASEMCFLGACTPSRSWSTFTDELKN